MADSIQNRRNQTTYLRQIQQEKASRKRDLTQSQSQEMKDLRERYIQLNKQVDEEAQAAILQIKEETKQIARQEKEEREFRVQQDQEIKQAERERKMQMAQSRHGNSGNGRASANSYNRNAQLVNSSGTAAPQGVDQKTAAASGASVNSAPANTNDKSVKTQSKKSEFVNFKDSNVGDAEV